MLSKICWSFGACGRTDAGVGLSAVCVPCFLQPVLSTRRLHTTIHSKPCRMKKFVFISRFSPPRHDPTTLSFSKSSKVIYLDDHRIASKPQYRSKSCYPFDEPSDNG